VHFFFDIPASRRANLEDTVFVENSPTPRHRRCRHALDTHKARHSITMGYTAEAAR